MSIIICVVKKSVTPALDNMNYAQYVVFLNMMYMHEYFSGLTVFFFLWQFRAELPLEPSLSRTIMEANNYGCISQALTVAAMLSTKTTLLPGRRYTHPKFNMIQTF